MLQRTKKQQLEEKEPGGIREVGKPHRGNLARVARQYSQRVHGGWGGGGGGRWRRREGAAAKSTKALRVLLYAWMDKWTDRWNDEWMNGRTDGWMDG